MPIRRAAVAGSWYPADPAQLRAEIGDYLAAADASADTPTGDLIALVAPHAGLRYSGPVAAHAYRLLVTSPADLIVLPAAPSEAEGNGGAGLGRVRPRLVLVDGEVVIDR